MYDVAALRVPASKKPDDRQFKVGDKIRVNLHHGKIEDAVVRAVTRDDDGIKLQVDVVGLDLTAEELKAPAVSVRLSSALSVGEHVYSIGAPEGLELTMSEGIISGLREFEHVHLIQTSAAISEGSGGGGLFDAQGKLVGITTFYLEEGQNLNFALPGEWVWAVASHRALVAEKSTAGNPAAQFSLKDDRLGESPRTFKTNHPRVEWSEFF